MSHDVPHLGAGAGLGPALSPDSEKGRPSLSHPEGLEGPRGERIASFDEKQRTATTYHDIGEVAATGEVATDAYGAWHCRKS